MSKDPAFLFYSSDFLVGTMTMTNEQVGKYIRLLCLQHQKGGYLSEKDMLSVCNAIEEAIFVKFDKTIDGLFFNDRLNIETNKRKQYSQSRRNNRLSEKSEDMSNISKSYDLHMENEISIMSLSLINNKDKRKKKIEVEKIKMGEFDNVYLTAEEFAKVKDLSLQEYIERLSQYKASSGKNYTSDYATIRQWKAKDDKANESKTIESKQKKGNTGDYGILGEVI